MCNLNLSTFTIFKKNKIVEISLNILFYLTQYMRYYHFKRYDYVIKSTCNKINGIFYILKVYVLSLWKFCIYFAFIAISQLSWKSLLETLDLYLIFVKFAVGKVNIFSSCLKHN